MALQAPAPPVVRPGDPGIDDRWLRRRRWGLVVTVLWFLLALAVMCAGVIARWGPFGGLVAWQQTHFGHANLLLTALPGLALFFVPGLVARLPKRTDRPFLFGVQDAFDPRRPPRLERGPAERRQTLQRVARGAGAVAAVALAVVAFGAWKGWHDAASPHAPLPHLTFQQVVAPGAPLPGEARVDGATAYPGAQWADDYYVRQTHYRHVYFPLAPPGWTPAAPVQLLELDPLLPDDAPAVYNMLDPPGAREGRLETPDDWVKSQLQRHGLRLADNVRVLERQQLHDRVSDPDPLTDFALFVIPALAVGLVAGLLAFSFGRQARRLA